MTSISPSLLRLMRVPQAPLATSVERGRFSLSCSDDPRDSFTRSALDRMAPPYTIACVANQPPDHTASAINLRRWAAFACVHAVEPVESDYAIVAALVPVHGKVLLIETVPVFAPAWVAFLAEKPGRHFLPEGGA